MSEVKIERRHREAAIEAHGWALPLKPWVTAWLDAGADTVCSPGGFITNMESENATARAVAATEQRVREECAQYVAWSHGHESGLSSICLLLNLAGLGKGVQVNTPADSGDFGRCLAMIKRFPEMRGRLSEATSISLAWANIAHHWVELEELYRARQWRKIDVLLGACRSCELVEHQREGWSARESAWLAGCLSRAKSPTEKAAAADDIAWWEVRAPALALELHSLAERMRGKGA